MRRLRSWGARAAVAAAALLLWAGVRRELHHRVPAATAEQLAQAQRVQVLRDKWGVPHIFGQGDADAAFGLAYAHAEDDWPTIQGVLAASTGRLSLLLLSKQALANDYYAQLIHAREQAAEAWPRFDPKLRALLDGYAAGLNLYAARHPREADARLLPLTGQDIVAGFVHKVPLMFNVPDTLQKLLEDKPLHAGDALALAETEGHSFPGSNAHALAAARSTDGVTRLNINSHQPWEGPVAWYEVQVHSEEGWNMTGGLFPGAPVVLHGHNDSLGWAHTVNGPDLVDAYELQMNPQRPHEYRLDGQWKALEEGVAHLDVDIGVLTLPLHKQLLASKHGPVLETGHGFYAVRYAGIGRAARAVEQWFKMDKARSLEEWKEAMRIQAIPMFNCVYADREHIFYVYNALLPRRAQGWDYTRLLPGDRSELIWDQYLPFDDLPQVQDPPSGFVFNTNTTPFAATKGPGNPDPDDFDESAGIDRVLNNRGLRSLELLGSGARLSAAEFERFKWDRTYGPGSRMIELLVRPVLAGFVPKTDAEKRALELLRAWDGRADESSPGAALAIVAYRALHAGPKRAAEQYSSDPDELFRRAVAFLEKNYGKVEVPLGEVQRLRRGAVDLPVGGGPDVLNALHADERDGHLVGISGDSYVLLVDFARDGPHSRSISQYGASNRPESPHYADQAPLFVKHQLRPVLRTREELRGALEREYIPGQ